MQAKQEKGSGRGRVTATPDPLPTESVHAPPASDEESSRASTFSQTVGTKKEENHSRERERNNSHGKMPIRMYWLNHPIFYDKTHPL